MKIKILLLMLISFTIINAQSVIIVGTDATLDVSSGADICSDSLAGTITGTGSFCGNPTDIKIEITEVIPTEFALKQNYPNPFNPSTIISYQLPLNSKVTLKVYDVLGNEVAILVDDIKSAGSYEIDFNASQFSSGLYLYKLQAGEFISTKKMILIK